MRPLQLVAAAMILFPGVAWAQDASPPAPQGEPPAAPAPAVVAPPPAAAPPPPPRAEATARADVDWEHRPSSGLALLITGSVITGLGLANLATSAPVCQGSPRLSSKQKNQCTEIALGISGGVTGLGLILLIAGGVQRSSYNEWRRENGIASHLDIGPLPRGAAAGFHASF